MYIAPQINPEAYVVIEINISILLDIVQMSSCNWEKILKDVKISFPKIEHCLH